MATLLKTLSIIITVIIIWPTTTTNTTTVAAASYLSPQPPAYNLTTLLNTLGFHGISAAATTFSTNPTTIFSPTDVSLRSCPSCSLPLLLLEHSVAGLYPFRLLKTLTFGTKFQTLASSPTTPLCLTLTKSPKSTLFINGVKITRPDLYNDGHVIVHEIQGYLTHLSNFSCQIQKMTSLSFPLLQFANMRMRGLLNDAVYNLRFTTDYTILALLIEQNVDMLSRLNSMTIFAVDDGVVFGEGHVFVSDWRFHIVVNRRLMALELVDLEVGSLLPTMVAGEMLVVTVAGGGGRLSPMRINNVRVMRTNVVFNQGIVVHGVEGPLPRVHHAAVGFWPDENGPTQKLVTF